MGYCVYVRKGVVGMKKAGIIRITSIVITILFSFFFGSQVSVTAAGWDGYLGGLPTSESWGYHSMNLDSFLESIVNVDESNEVVVAVIDSGIDTDHEWFKGRIKTGGANCINATSICVEGNYEDDHGHGTHVAGIIAKGTPANVKILPIKVLNSANKGKHADMWSAIDYVIRLKQAGMNIVAINYSISSNTATELGSSDSENFRKLFAKAYDNGILSVVSAGNDHRDVALTTPAHLGNEVITVSAFELFPNFYWPTETSYSNYGEEIDFTAPGTDIYSASVGGGVVSMSGTSMAAPHVTAAIAGLKLACPQCTPQEIENILRETADDMGSASKDIYFGYGIIDMMKAYEYLSIEKHTLTVEYYEDQTKIMSSGGNYVKNITSRVQLHKHAGYVLKNIIVDNQAISAEDIEKAKQDGFYDVLIEADCIVKVFYEKQDYVISYYVREGNYFGRLYEAPIAANTNYLVNIENYSSNHKVVSVVIDGVKLTAEEIENMRQSGYLFESVTKDHEVIVEYSQNTFDITVDYVPWNNVNTVTNSVTYLAVKGTDVDIEFLVPEGSSLYGVSIDGIYKQEYENILATGKYTFSDVQDNHHVKISYKLKEFQISVLYETNGITKLGVRVSLEYGQEGAVDTRLSSVCQTCELLKIVVDDIELSHSEMTEVVLANKYVFSNVQDNHTIKFVYTAQNHSITYNVSMPEGFNSYGGVHMAIDRENFDFEINQYDNLEVYQIIVDGKDLSETEIRKVMADGVYTFENVLTFHRIHVYYRYETFSINYYVIEGEEKRLVSQQQVEYMQSSQPFKFDVANQGVDVIKVDSVPLTISAMGAFLANGHLFESVTSDHVVEIVMKSNYYKIYYKVMMGEELFSQNTFIVDPGASRNILIQNIVYASVDRIVIDGLELSRMDVLKAMNNGYRFTNVYQNHEIIVFYVRGSYTITNCEIVNDQSSCVSNEVTRGGSYTKRIQPKEDLIVTQIEVDGETLDDNAKRVAIRDGITFNNVQSNHIITVVYKTIPLQISYYTARNDINEGTPDLKVIDAYKNLTIHVPIEVYLGYDVTAIIVDGTSLNHSAMQSAIKEGITFENVNESHEIIVKHVRKSYVVYYSVQDEEGKSLKFDDEFFIAKGNDTKITVSTIIARETAGFIIDGRVLEGEELEEALLGNGYTFRNVQSDHTMVVIMKRTAFVLQIYKQFAYRSTGSNTAMPMYKNYTLEIEKIDGYRISNVKIDEEALSANDLARVAKDYAYTFENVSSDHSIRIYYEEIVNEEEKGYLIKHYEERGNDYKEVAVYTVLNGASLNVTIREMDDAKAIMIIVDGQVLTQESFEETMAKGYYAFNNVAEDHIITVIYERIKFTVNYCEVYENDSNSVKCTSSEHQIGSDATIYFNHVYGYQIKAIFVNNLLIPTDGWPSLFEDGYTIQNIQMDYLIKVIYTDYTYIFHYQLLFKDEIEKENFIEIKKGGTIDLRGLDMAGREIVSVNVNGAELSKQKIAKLILTGFVVQNVDRDYDLKITYKVKEHIITKHIIDEYNNMRGFIEYKVEDGKDFSVQLDKDVTVLAVEVDRILLDQEELQEAIDNGYVFENVKQSHSIIIRHTATKFTITYIEVSGSNRKILNTRDYPVNYGENFKLNFAVSYPGLYISYMSIHGTPVQEKDLQNVVNGGYVFENVNKDYTVIVTLSKKQYTINASYFGVGYVSFVGDKVVEYGSELTVNFSNNGGKVIKSVYVDGVFTKCYEWSNGSYTFKNIDANHSIRIVFSENEYNIRVYEILEDTGEKSYFDNHVVLKDDMTISFRQKAGYRIKVVLIDGKKVSSLIIMQGRCKFRDVMESHVVHVIYEKL